MSDLRITLTTWTDEETGIVQPRVVVTDEHGRTTLDFSTENFRKFWSEGGELLRRLDEDGPPDSTDDA